MIVTSFSQTGYHKYGKRFIETFLKHWSDENLIVFYERGIPSNAPKDDRIKYVDLFKYETFVKFRSSISKSHCLFKGQLKGVGKNGEDIYDFRMDADRFFCKVFSIFTAHAEFQSFNTNKYLTWLDADTFSYKDVPEGFVGSLMNENYLAFLGRPGLYSECGFMAFDTTFEEHEIFMDSYLRMYLTGAFTYLGEYHDCYVLDKVRTLLQVKSIDLAKGVNSNHPFIYTVLGRYMDHLKGPQRKELGKSPELDDIVGTVEPVTPVITAA